jgi:dUTP pyrophosphatase
MIPGVTPETLQEEKDYYKNIIYDISQEPDLSENKKEFFTLLFTAIADVHEQLILSGRTQIEVKITKLNPDAIIPQYAHPTDAGADVAAVEETTIQPGETKIVKTGIAVAIPAGYEIQIRPRSGLSVKTKLRIPNAPGTIDTEYRGEIGVPICNTGDIPYVIEKGMKIAQMLIAPTPMIKWDEVATVEELGTTSRGEGGFGSTDKAANAG